jgi:Mrp family chromosome partitioning ATPase
MRELLERCSKMFDFVIIDTPPILGLPDALTLAPKAVGCLMVVRHAKASYKNVLKAKEALEMVNGHILGAILNAIKPEPFGYYYYSGYYYSKHYSDTGDVKSSENKESVV